MKDAVDIPPQNGKMRHLFLRVLYGTGTVLNYEQVLIYDFNAILAAVGGSLGLFLGFSCYQCGKGLIDFCCRQTRDKTAVKRWMPEFQAEPLRMQPNSGEFGLFTSIDGIWFIFNQEHQERNGSWKENDREANEGDQSTHPC